LSRSSRRKRKRPARKATAWQALTLELERGHAEAFSEALLEAGAQSVALEDARAGAAGEQVLYDEGPGAPPRAWARNRLSALLAPREDPLRLVAAAARVAGLAAPPEFDLEAIDEEDWVRRSQAQFGPLQAGRRIWIVPSWHEARAVAPRGALVIRLDPGIAFGTGSHPSTRLALRFLERAIPELLREGTLHAPLAGRGAGGAGQASRLASPATALRVLDYGCGSGILAIAAAGLGAAQVDAVDLDADALKATAHNARANRAAVRTALPQALAPGDYDLIVANILAGPLAELAPRLAARARRGARLGLSGVLADQAEGLRGLYARWFEARIAEEEEGWVLIEGVRR
jgi:ribosomal protein L11 methyltransferase